MRHAVRKYLIALFSSIGFIAIVAFVVRLIFLVHTFHVYEEPAVRDNLQFGAETGAIAAAIASGRGFSSPLRFLQTGPSAWLAPIYPYMLAGVFKLFGTYSYTSNIVIRVLDCAFSALTCWPLAAIATKAFGKRVGIASAWLWVFLPTAIFFPVIWVWDTTLAGLWMALLIAATFELRGSTRAAHWIGYGALWGAGAMINPSLLAILPFLGLWAIWPLRWQIQRAAQLTAFSALVFACCLVPWTVRNYVTFHKFIPLRSNWGLELWLGNNAEVPDTWTPYLHPNDNINEARKYAAMTEIPYMEEKKQEAYAFLWSHPRDSARFFFHRFADTWLGVWDSPVDLWKSISLYYKLLLVSNILFSLLAFLGILFACRSHNEYSLPLASVMLFFPIVFYLTHATQRYRYPMDCVMAVLAVFAIAYPLSRLASRFSRGAGQAKPATEAPAAGLIWPQE